jgi:hypothetical protein
MEGIIGMILVSLKSIKMLVCIAKNNANSEGLRHESLD